MQIGKRQDVSDARRRLFRASHSTEAMPIPTAASPDRTNQTRPLSCFFAPAGVAATAVGTGDGRGVATSGGDGSGEGLAVTPATRTGAPFVWTMSTPFDTLDRSR